MNTQHIFYLVAAYACAPYLYVKYLLGRRTLVASLPAPGKSKERRFTRIDEITENLDTLFKASKVLSVNEKLWKARLEQAEKEAATPYDSRPVFRLGGADAQVETFKDYFSAWKMRGLRKNLRKPARRVKLNYYPDNTPPAYREQMVSLSTAIAAEHDDIEYPLPMTSWEASVNSDGAVDTRTHAQRTADKYIKDGK